MEAKKQTHVLFGNPSEHEINRLKALGYTVEVKPRSDFDMHVAPCGADHCFCDGSCEAKKESHS